MAIVLSDEQLRKACTQVRMVRVEPTPVDEEPQPEGAIFAGRMPDFEPIRMRVTYDIFTGKILSCVPDEGGE